MGQCTAEERAEVERMAATHPEVHAELQAIGLAIEKFVAANAVPPPPGLKNRILEALEREAAQDAVRPEVSKNVKTNLLTWVPALLSLLLAGLLWVSNTAKGRLQETVAQVQKQLSDCETRSQADAKVQRQIALVQHPETRAIPLAKTGAGTAGTVFHNPTLRETTLELATLAAPNPGKYFQFWAIVDGKPVSMGMVQLNHEGIWQNLPYVENAQAFAISEEDNPQGNPTPTTVVMVGKAG